MSLERLLPPPAPHSYAGGNDVVRGLAKMANDKHTVGLTVIGTNVSTSHPSYSDGNGRLRMRSIKVGMGQWHTEKNEMELVRWLGEVQVHGEYKFIFEVLFSDPRLPHPVNVFAALSEFAAKADAVIESLQTACIAIKNPA